MYNAFVPYNSYSSKDIDSLLSNLGSLKREDIFALISYFDSMSNKSDFNGKVREYKKIVYSHIVYPYDHSNRTGVDELSSIDTPLDMIPDISDTLQRIESWVTTFQSTIWNFESSPFSFRNEKSSSALQQYYKKAQVYLTRFFSDIEFNFKTAFSQTIRSWFELGMGVIVMQKNNWGNYVLTAVPPEKVSVLYDEFGEATTYIISNASVHGTEIFRVYWKTSFNNWEGIEYEYSREDDDWKISFPHHKCEHTPVYVAMFSAPSGAVISYGRGIQLLPVLKKINNLMKSLQEAGSSAITPVLTVPEGLIDTARLKVSGGDVYQSIGCKLIPQNMVVGDTRETIHALPRVYDMKIVDFLLGTYLRHVSDALSPNSLILAKGTSGMSVAETQLRDSYDKVEITYHTAGIIDHILKPMILSMLKEFKHEIDSDKTLLNQLQLEGIDPLDATVDINNVRGEQQTNERVRQLSTYMQLSASVNQMKQGGLPSADAIQHEIDMIFGIEDDKIPDNVRSVQQETNNMISQNAQLNIANRNIP